RFVPTQPDEWSSLRRMRGIEESTFVIISVGNCSHVKNHALLIEALASLRGRLDFHYLHVGMEELGYPERRLSDELGIADRVTFLGYVDDVLPYLRLADLFVMPSLYEGLGNAA